MSTKGGPVFTFSLPGGEWLAPFLPSLLRHWLSLYCTYTTTKPSTGPHKTFSWAASSPVGAGWT